MIDASHLKTGGVVRLGSELFKVVESITHAGGGKAGSMVHAKLRNLSTGHVAERRFSPGEKVADIEVSRVKMQFLYREGEAFTFMNSETFDQVPIAQAVIGAASAFLKENDELEVEFFEAKPLAVLYPSAVELRVSSTGAGVHGQSASTMKEAVLENGMSLLVPHFIKESDLVRVEVETGKYLDRVSQREEKGARFTTAAPPVKAESKAEAKPEEKDKGKEKGKS